MASKKGQSSSVMNLTRKIRSIGEDCVMRQLSVKSHPCPSDDNNQRHTSVRHLVQVVGVVAVAVFALGKISPEGVKQDAQAGL